MPQVGYTEVIDYYEVEVKNDTSIVQVHYSANGEKLTLKPGAKGVLLKARVMTISNDEMAQMAREGDLQPKVPSKKKAVGRPAKGKKNGDRSDVEGKGKEIGR
jgi:hypothetical protein